MSFQTYATKKSAAVAAKRNLVIAQTADAGYTSKVYELEDGRWAFDLIEPTPATPVDLDSMGLYGAGTEEAPVCPHCGINHIGNGFAGFNANGDQARNGSELFLTEFECLACGGGWGAKLDDQSFEAQMQAANFQAPRNLCRALRTVASSWTGSRKAFIQGAKDLGLNVANAAAEWQSARQR